MCYLDSVYENIVSGTYIDRLSSEKRVEIQDYIQTFCDFNQWSRTIGDFYREITSQDEKQREKALTILGRLIHIYERSRTTY